MKNAKEESGKCKTIIQIDGEQVFVSDAYNWKFPNINTFGVTEFGVAAGSSCYNNKKLKAFIKNVKISSHE